MQKYEAVVERMRFSIWGPPYFPAMNESVNDPTKGLCIDIIWCKNLMSKYFLVIEKLYSQIIFTIVANLMVYSRIMKNTLQPILRPIEYTRI